MKPMHLLAASVLSMGTFAIPTRGQDNPPPPPREGPRDGQREREAQPPQPSRRAADQDQPAPRRPRGEAPGMPGMPGAGMRPDAVPGDRPRLRAAQAIPFEQVDRMRDWLDVIERYTRMAHNPTDAGIAAVVTANDLLRPRGPEPAIDYFKKILPEVKNEAVQRAIRLQLVELYKATGQQEQALDQLQSLMTTAPSEPPVPHAPPAPLPLPRHE